MSEVLHTQIKAVVTGFTATAFFKTLIPDSYAASTVSFMPKGAHFLIVDCQFFDKSIAFHDIFALDYLLSDEVTVLLTVS